MLSTVPVTPIHYSAAPTLIVRNAIKDAKPAYYIESGLKCTETQCPITINGSSYFRSVVGTIGVNGTQTFNFGMVDEFDKLVSNGNSGEYMIQLDLSSISEFDARTFGDSHITIMYNMDYTNHTFYWTVNGESYTSGCLDVVQDSQTVTATIYC